jgi:hypothetical protein
MTGTPEMGAVTFALKVSISCSKVKLPHCVWREIEAVIGTDVWKSGESVLLAAMGTEDIWKYLHTMVPLPHHSQFHVISGPNDISKAATGQRTRLC